MVSGLTSHPGSASSRILTCKVLHFGAGKISIGASVVSGAQSPASSVAIDRMVYGHLRWLPSLTVVEFSIILNAITKSSIHLFFSRVCLSRHLPGHCGVHYQLACSCCLSDTGCWRRRFCV